VETFVKVGYTRGKNIRGAPYDFRKAPNDNEEYFVDLAALVEETYEINGNTSSVLLCHSMGCTYSLYFLNRRSDEWKEKYIKSLVSLGAPWSGAIMAVKAYTAGDNFGVVVYSDGKLRGMERSFSSLAFLLPSAKSWPHNQSFVQNGDRSYTPSNYEDLFIDLNDAVGYQMYLNSRDLISDLKHPGVDVHCIHGTGKDTTERLIYDKDTHKFPDNPEVVFGDGDGTVNRKSLEECIQWKDHPVHDFGYRVFPDTGHVEMIKTDGVINHVLELVVDS